MSKKKRPIRGQNGPRRPAGGSAVISSAVAYEKIDDPNKEPDVPIMSMLFKPLIYKSSSVDRTIDFEHLLVPFMVNGDLVFSLMFMDSFDLSVYIECHEIRDGKNPYQDSHQDGTQVMKSAMEAEKITGIEYYFGKLGKAYNQYLYALQLFVDRNLITRARALELAKELGCAQGDLDQATVAVNNDIDKSKERRRQQEAHRRVSDAIGEFMMQMVMPDVTKSGSGGAAQNDVSNVDSVDDEDEAAVQGIMNALSGHDDEYKDDDDNNECQDVADDCDY